MVDEAFTLVDTLRLVYTSTLLGSTRHETFLRFSDILRFPKLSLLLQKLQAYNHRELLYYSFELGDLTLISKTYPSHSNLCACFLLLLLHNLFFEFRVDFNEHVNLIGTNIHHCINNTYRQFVILRAYKNSARCLLNLSINLISNINEPKGQ